MLGNGQELTRRLVRVVAVLTVCAAGAAVPRTSEAKGTIASARGPQPWCAPEIEALPNGRSDVCYLDGGRDASRRTLVIFLHGATAKNTTWSWNHERGIMKLAKAAKIEVLYPRGPETEPGYVWPGTLESQERVEQDIIDGWMQAKHTLEQRDGRPFDEVFVMGFSSGAYFASSLAMRGRADVDGYAVFAGGQAMGARTAPVQHFAPVFVGVCADDETTAPHSRAFAAALTGAGIPRTVNEQHVGHGLSHVHFNYALSYLRHMKARVAAR